MLMQALVVCGVFASAGFFQPARPGTPDESRRQPGGPNMAERFVDRLMAQDANGDGKLSRDEVPERVAERLFDDADADKDGFLTREELTTFMANRRGPAAGGPPEEDDAAGPPQTFDDSMHRAGRAFRTLRRSPLDESSRETDLKALQAVEVGLLSAKTQFGEVEWSEKAKAEFGEDKDAYAKAFRMHLLRALSEALEAEKALVEGDSAAAKTHLTKLNELREQSHTLFQTEEDEDERPARGGGMPAPKDGDD
ncbi:MAG: EF-hand domain-containing protein [Phycisphaeraceae bacterium]|nr:MAG: EF-hand domain-containing protein [Phycisphaeraceae bacterium]